MKLRIFAFDPGRSFTYDVYEWTNFPLKHMHSTFAVEQDAAGRTVLVNVIDYKLKPGIMTGLARGQMTNAARRTLLAFKHFLETGEGDVEERVLEERYPGT